MSAPPDLHLYRRPRSKDRSPRLHLDRGPRSKRAPLVLLTSLALASGACGLETSPSPEAIAQRSAAITYGEPDTEHEAVVTVVQKVSGQAMSCGATVIARRGRSAYALTAAHCLAKHQADGSLVLPPEAASKGAFDIVFGDNWYIPDPEIKIVLEVAIHPNFTGIPPTTDVGMVRFVVNDASLPLLAALTPSEDTLTVGTKLEMVGFGMIEGGKANTSRRHIVKPIDTLDAHFIRFDQQGTTGGSCRGDSGGPALTLETSQRVAGVVSGGGSCTGTSTFTRVSATYDDFIKPFIESSSGEITCLECREASIQTGGPCINAYNACNANPDCPAYFTCAAKCKDAACGAACAHDHATGATLARAIRSCACETACVAECQKDPICNKPATCGLNLPTNACATCSATSCCQAEGACAADPTCKACAEATPLTTTCAAPTLYDAWLSCLDSHCANVCQLPQRSDGHGVSDDGGPPPGDSAGEDTAAPEGGCAVGRSEHGTGLGALLALLLLLTLGTRRPSKR